MWLILTILCAIATYLSVVYLDSLIPAFVFLGLAVIFLIATWNSKKSRK